MAEGPPPAASDEAAAAGPSASAPRPRVPELDAPALRRPPRAPSPAAASDSSDGFARPALPPAMEAAARRRPLPLWHDGFKETPFRSCQAAMVEVIERWNTRRRRGATCCLFHSAMRRAASTLDELTSWPCSRKMLYGVTWQCSSCGVLQGDDDEECVFCGQERPGASGGSSSADIDEDKRNGD